MRSLMLAAGLPLFAPRGSRRLRRPLGRPDTMKRLLAFVALAAAVTGCGAEAQPQSGTTALRSRVESQGEIRLGDGVLVRRYGTGQVEAVLTVPAGRGRHPGVVLVPGYDRSAWDMQSLALRLAEAGFATVAVSQPGFGGSAGPADFSGPGTYAALLALSERFAAEPFVDRTRLGIYGFSRGGLAAAQLAARTDLFRATVLAAGIYDFAAAFDEAPPGIRLHMLAEAGNSPEAIRFRSPIHDMAGLDGPVLILHGAADERAPPGQARALERRLAAFGREHQLVLFPDAGHRVDAARTVALLTSFFRRHLADP